MNNLGHFLNSRAWAEFRQALGEQTRHREADQWSYLSLIQSVGGFKKLYCPYSPVVHQADGMVELMADLEEKWTDIYLLRNEKAVKIYSFEDGRAFEPDFLMFANDKKTGNVSWQIFIEPKGGQFLDSDNTFENSKEGWKQKFLLQISERDEARTLVDEDRYRIIGLPFYNHTVSEELVKEELRGL